MNRSPLALYALIAGFALSLPAQEQTILVDGPKGIVPQPESLMDITNAKITIANAKTLIGKTLGAGVISKNSTVIIHILRWKDDGKLDKQNWFVYHDGINSQEEFTGLRIYGRHDVSLLYVHLNAKAATEGEVARYTAVNKMFENLFARFGLADTQSLGKAEFLKCVAAVPDFLSNSKTQDDRDKLCPKGKPGSEGIDDRSLLDQQDKYVQSNPDQVTARLALAPALAAGDDCEVPINASGNPRFLDKYCVAPNYLNVGYKVVATPKLPAAIGDFLKLIQPQAKLHVAQLKVDSVAVWGGDQMTITPVPSDVKVTPIAEDKELDSRTFDNEGLYFWDISVGLPIKSIKDTTYDEAGQSFTAKKVERQSLYALFNVFPRKLDTKATGNWRVTPAALMGIGIVNHPLDRLMFGGGLGIGKVQFFVGTAMTKKRFPQADGKLSDPVYRTNLVYGLNVPIRQVLDKLKAKK